MSKRASVIDVAKACGVSPSTVCRALNTHADIKEETRKRILAVCARMGYCRNAAARSLRLSGSGAVALLMPDQAHELFIEKALALKSTLGERGMPWRLWSHANADQAARFVEEIVGFRPLGLIASSGLSEKSIKLLKRNNIPVVCHDMDVPGLDCVALDRESAAFETVSHLLASGRRRILAMGLGRYPASDRATGYHRAHQAAGVEVDPALEWDADYQGRNLFEYGCEQVLLALRELRFDAVHAVDDAVAIGVIRALHDEKIAVPGDIAVTGFDGIMAAAYVVPSLTTAAQPKEEMARLAVDFLLNRISSPKTPRQFVRLNTVFQRRESA